MSRIVQINGKKVVDANYRMAVLVTPEDIKKGDRKKPNACAVALACVRQLDAESAVVNLTRTYIEFPKRWVRFATPASVRTEIVAFDQGGKFTPGQYVMSPPAPTQRSGAATKRVRGTRKYKKRAKPHHPEGVRARASLFKVFEVKEEK